MVTVAQLDVLLRAPLSKLDSDLDKATDRFRTFGTNLTKVGAGLTARVTLPIVAIGGAALKVASDAQESENLFNVALGSMADQARRFSEEISDRLGISAFTIRENVGVLFQMTSAMGIAEDQALELATGLSELTQDLASFFNLRPEDAFRRLQSGIVGEIEPLRRLGILVDEQTAKQALLNKGLIQQGQELSQQEKVLGRYFAILEQTKNAQGDLERTSGDLANITRRLKEQLKDTGIELGQLLIPAAEKALTALEGLLGAVRSLVAGFKELPQGVQVATGAFLGLAAATGPLTLVLGQLLGVAADVAIVMRFGLVASLAKILPLLAVGGPIVLGVAAAAAGFTLLANEIGRSLGPIRTARDEIADLAVNIGALSQVELLAEQAGLQKRIDELEFFRQKLEAVRRIAASRPDRQAVDPISGEIQTLAQIENAQQRAADAIADAEQRLGEVQGRLFEVAGALQTLSTQDVAVGGIDAATTQIRGMVEILREAAREVGLLDERARAFGPAFDVARERVAILEGVLDDLFRLDQTPEVLAAIDDIARQLAAAQLAVEAFELPPLTLNIEVPDFALDFRDIGREAATTFVSSFSRGIGSLTDKLLSVFGRIFDRIAGDFIAKLIQGIGAAGGGPLAAIPLVSTLASLNPFGSVAPSATAVSPAAQFTTIPKESLSPLTIHALARDPVVQSLSREIALVAQEDGF